MSSNKIRKKLERETELYSRGKNHFIDQDLKAYHHAKELRDSREQQERYIQHTTEYIDSKYALVKDILTETEFISDQAITPAAEIALQIKEANALTLTKLLLSTNSFCIAYHRRNRSCTELFLSGKYPLRRKDKIILIPRTKL